MGGGVCVCFLHFSGVNSIRDEVRAPSQLVYSICKLGVEGIACLPVMEN